MPITFNRPETTSNLIFMTGTYHVQDTEDLDIDVSPYMNVIDDVMIIPSLRPALGNIGNYANEIGNNAHATPLISTPETIVVSGTTVSIYNNKFNATNMSTSEFVKNSAERKGNFCIIGRK